MLGSACGSRHCRREEVAGPIVSSDLPTDNRAENLWGGVDTSLESGSPASFGKSVLIQPAVHGTHGATAAASRPTVGGRQQVKAVAPDPIEGVVTGFDKRIREFMLFKLLMTQDYLHVKTSDVWHVLRLYHRLYMAGVTTEAMAESVGSLLTQRTSGQGHGMPPRRY